MDRLAGAGVSGLIVPDLPLEEAPSCAPAATRAGWRSCRWSPRPPPTSASRGSARGARGFLYTVSLTGTTGERAELAGGAARTVIARAAAHTDVPVAVGFGISTPEQAAAAADAGADGVIVGTPARPRRRRGRRSGRRGARARVRVRGSAVRSRPRLASAIPWA